MTTASELYARALRAIPVNSPVRAMKAVGTEEPLLRGVGGGLPEDVEGRRYVDWVMS